MRTFGNLNKRTPIRRTDELHAAVGYAINANAPVSECKPLTPGQIVQQYRALKEARPNHGVYVTLYRPSQRQQLLFFKQDFFALADGRVDEIEVEII